MIDSFKVGMKRKIGFFLANKQLQLMYELVNDFACVARVYATTNMHFDDFPQIPLLGRPHHSSCRDRP